MFNIKMFNNYPEPTAQVAHTPSIPIILEVMTQLRELESTIKLYKNIVGGYLGSNHSISSVAHLDLITDQANKMLLEKVQTFYNWCELKEISKIDLT